MNSCDNLDLMWGRKQTFLNVSPRLQVTSTVQTVPWGRSCYSVLTRTMVTIVKVSTFFQTGFKWGSCTQQMNSLQLCPSGEETFKAPMSLKWNWERNSQSVLLYFFSLLKEHKSDNFRAEQAQPNIQLASFLSYKYTSMTCRRFSRWRRRDGWPLVCSRELNCRWAVWDFSCQICAPARPLAHLPKPELWRVWNANLERQGRVRRLIFSRAAAASSSPRPSGSNPSSQTVETLSAGDILPTLHPSSQSCRLHDLDQI